MNFKNLIERFWQGKVTLWKSYWIVGELINGLFYIILYNIEIFFFQNSNLAISIPFVDIVSLSPFTKILVIVWTVFITIGIWKSAEKYKGNFIWIILTLLILSFRIFALKNIIFS